ncbi:MULTISPECIES: ABC transporter permease [Streptomyces]|uniref:ABC transporter permease n=1 Tax=Streptomyces TaxID=1883 RepID=UPI001E285165|nr:FtsX family ABC transporter permease [Streptomyces scabiei]MDX2653487.1 ABC transporter permease [Streptomyces scabiei]MDX2723173.1 ABC transporter permease [Streptomyces scabiei]MDX2866418.1 ABC transporter permease [Streptomyces scabiei]MDX2883750.1 ABC transporter permease [Streptomyces scabiei]MDX2890428.1 ABC transporter permease [Streptomyces scabiei]
MHKARLLMTMLAVLLGVAFVAGTLVFTDTVGNAYKQRYLSTLRDVSVQVTPPFDETSGEPGTVGMDTLRRLRRLPGVASVTGSVEGFAAVAAKDGRPLGEGHVARAGNYFPQADGKDDRHPLTTGRAPAGPDEVLMDTSTADQGGYEVGDTVRLAIDGPVLHKKLVGIVRIDAASGSGGTSVFFDDATAQKLLLRPGQYDGVSLDAEAGASEQRLAAAARGLLPEESEISTGAQLREQRRAEAAEGAEGLSQVLLAFAAIALFVGVFVIGNTFTMLATQRSQETALLRAVGAGRRQVTRSVLVEAALLGLCAEAAGFLLGIGVALTLRQLFASTGSGVPDGPLVVAPGTVLVSFVVGVVVTMVAAYLPARRAAAVPPVAAMSALHTPPPVRSLRRRNTLGVVLIVLGVLGVVSAASSGEQGRTIVLVPSALLLIGLIVVTPALSGPAIALAGPLLRRFGVPGTLAARNARRNPRRTASTASALMIGLSMVTGLTVVAVSATTALARRAESTVTADFEITSRRGGYLPASVHDTLAKSTAVTSSSPQRQSAVRLGGEEVNLTGVDARSIADLLDPSFTSGSPAALGTGGGKNLLIDTATADLYGWTLGRRVPVVYGDGSRDTLRIGGIYRADEFLPATMMPLTTLQPHLKKTEDASVLVHTQGGDGETPRRALQRALDQNPLIRLRNTDDLAASAGGGDISLLLDLLYGLLAMAVVIAVLGVVNTLAMSVAERTREIGMLRAVGLQPEQTKRMIHLESVLISLFGALLGIGAGLFLGWAAGRLASGSIQGYETVIPWGRIAAALAGAALVGVVAGLWPARRAARLNVLTALKAD